MSRRLSCPFCPHGNHDGRDCERCLPSECCGANEQERTAFDAPEEITDWLAELIEADTWGGSAVGATEVVGSDDYLEVETKFGRWRLKVERAT